MYRYIAWLELCSGWSWCTNRTGDQAVAALHQGEPGQMTWHEDPPPWLRPAYCFASVNSVNRKLKCYHFLLTTLFVLFWQWNNQRRALAACVLREISKKGRQLFKEKMHPLQWVRSCLRVTWLDDFLTSKWPSSFTALEFHFSLRFICQGFCNFASFQPANTWAVTKHCNWWAFCFNFVRVFYFLTLGSVYIIRLCFCGHFILVLTISAIQKNRLHNDLFIECDTKQLIFCTPPRFIQLLPVQCYR